MIGRDRMHWHAESLPDSFSGGDDYDPPPSRPVFIEEQCPHFKTCSIIADTVIAERRMMSNRLADSLKVLFDQQVAVADQPCTDCPVDIAIHLTLPLRQQDE